MILIEPQRPPKSDNGHTRLRTRCEAGNGVVRRCALVATSVQEAVALQRRGNVDFVVVRLESAADFHLLASDSSSRTRLIGVLTVGDSPTLDRSVQEAIGAAAANPGTTLAVGLSGPAASIAMHAYLGVVAKRTLPGGVAVAERPAGNGSGNGRDILPPSAPLGLAASDVTQTGATLRWTAATDNKRVAGYGIYVNGSKIDSTRTTTYSVTGLVCAKVYTLSVDAYDQAGNRSVKTSVTASTASCPPPPTDTQAPTMPGNLRATATTGTSITVAWAGSTDNVAVMGYGLYRNGTLAGSATALTYTFSGLACGTGYTVSVDAYDAAGNRSQQAAITAATGACSPAVDTQPPTVPGNLHVTTATETSITVAWNASTDNVAVTGYGLYRNGSLTGSATTLTYTFSGLACGTGYTLAVDAYDAAGNRSQSASIGASSAPCAPPPPPTDTQPPTMPGNLRATAATGTSITVAWNPSTDNVAVTGYGLYRNGTLTGSASALTYTFSGLACGTGYTLTVDAYDAAGNRSQKAAITAATGACPPPADTQAPTVPGNLRATVATGTSITVVWNVSTDNVGVTGYGLYNGSSSVGTVGATLLTYTFSGLSCGTGYTLAVDAFDAAGNRSGKATLTAATSACPPPPPGGEPGPIAGQGYTKVFGDEFDTLNRSIWDNHIWYDSPAPADTQYVQDGVFHLVSRRSQGYPNVDATTYTSNKTFMFGYFEARMRWTGGQGAWPAFWLMSKGWADTANCSTPSSEIDMMEGQGAEPNSFYGTIHSDSAGRCSGHKQNSNNWDSWPTRLADNWHTYAAKWTQSQVCWYVDDILAHCANTYADTDDSPMFVLLYMWTGGWTGGTNSTTPAELHTEVDWVRVWQK